MRLLYSYVDKSLRTRAIGFAAALAAAGCVGVSVASGQSSSASTSGEPSHPPHAIQDNSFLVEEAYNQEEGIVQHISQFTRDHASGDWLFTFTQEWPLPGDARHQVSATLPLARVSGTHSRGPEDAALNYRYQLVGDDKEAVAVAPRLTVFLPTGRSDRELGAGGPGLQVEVPVSTLLSDDWIAHENVGGNWIPSARNVAGNRASTVACNAGASVIWIGSPILDLMLETVYSRFQTVVSRGRTSWDSSWLVSPGIRWAYNFSSGLQIVPGVAFPIGIGPSRGSRQILLYLSFEHPFRTPDRPPAP